MTFVKLMTFVNMHVHGPYLNLLDSAPRCTPPTPPVTKIEIPAICAAIMVPETVVPPFSPCNMQMKNT